MCHHESLLVDLHGNPLLGDFCQERAQDISEFMSAWLNLCESLAAPITFIILWFYIGNDQKVNRSDPLDLGVCCLEASFVLLRETTREVLAFMSLHYSGISALFALKSEIIVEMIFLCRNSGLHCRLAKWYSKSILVWPRSKRFSAKCVNTKCTRPISRIKTLSIHFWNDVNAMDFGNCHAHNNRI